MTSKLHTVFVYGTLKRGEPNHSWFMKAQNGYFKFICDAETVNKYPLIIATKYNIPFLLQHPGKGNNVQGEVYEIDDLVLSNLDILEDHPNFYVREKDEVKSLDGSDKIINTWIYFIKRFKSNLLEQSMFVDYRNMGDHGLRYVTSDEDACIDDLN